MKKKTKISILAVLISFQTSNAVAGYFNNYYDPRVSIWGLAGTQQQARTDLLLPLLSDQNNIFYTDFQGSYTSQGNFSENYGTGNDANYLSAGAGFRKMFDNNVLGTYLFYDRDETRSHHYFNVVNMGVEDFFYEWDVRVNGYLPLDQQKTFQTFSSPLPCDCGDCGNIVTNDSGVFFRGHQQYGHLFSMRELAGRGGDAEIGYTFHHLNNTQLHGGVYYFNFYTANPAWNFSHTSHNITGIEGRLETPINQRWAVTVEASYDKYQHGAIVGGLRFNLFPSNYASNDLRRHMTSPITRNVGTLKTGTGVPTIIAKHDDGIFLQRDNIYFFSATGGSTFVDPATSGTFENPLRNDQFSQSVVNQIGNNANFYFPTGTYVIMGSGLAIPNANINFLSGDSIFGRTPDYLNAAMGNSRPIFLGSLTLPGNNTLASMQLFNNGFSTGSTNASFTSLNIINAPNILLCNDNIVSTSTVNGDLQAGISNMATGIFAQNSQVVVRNSSIHANAIVNGSIILTGIVGGFNSAVGVGGNSITTPANFVGNSFNIQNSAVNANAFSQTNSGSSFAAGIGSNVSGTGSANFSNNNFIINNSSIAANTSSNNLGINSGTNSAIGIGNNKRLNTASNGDFTNNTFTVQNSQIVGSAAVTNNGSGIVNSLGIGTAGDISFTGNNFNLINTMINATSTVGGNNSQVIIATGIGNSEFGNSFSNNIFSLTNCNINVFSSVRGSNLDDPIFGSFGNMALGIGNNNSNAFNNNIFTIVNSTITANATVAGSNSTVNGNDATGIGGFFDRGFVGNRFSISNTHINAISAIGGSNTTLNFANGIGDLAGQFQSNQFNLDNVTIHSLATVAGNNVTTGFYSNLAIGVGAGIFSQFTGNTFNMTNTSVITTATVGGNNLGSNQAIGIGNFLALTDANNIFNLNNIGTFDTLSNVNGINSGINSSIGMEAIGAGDVITIINAVPRIVNTTAIATGPGTNTATGHIGNVIFNPSTTIFNDTP